MSTTTPDPQETAGQISDDDIRRDAADILHAPTSMEARRVIQAAQSTSQWSSMARIKPQDRPAGPDTDVAIAMQVMGWSYCADGYGQMAWFDLEQDEPVETMWGEGVVEYARRKPFHPTTDIAAAWVVLEQFVWPRFWPRLIRTDKGHWRCDIELNGGDGPNRSAWAETAPLAICRAALAAVGV